MVSAASTRGRIAPQRVVLRHPPLTAYVREQRLCSNVATPSRHLFPQPALMFAVKPLGETAGLRPAPKSVADVETPGGRRVSRRRLNKLSCAGWLPHDRGFVSGLPRSKGRASAERPAHNRRRGFPNRPAARQALRDKRSCACAAVSFACESGYLIAGCAWTIRAIAQMKPTISRAIAVVTTTLGLPAAARRR